MIDFSKLILGTTSRLLILESAADNIAATQALIRQAKHTLYLFTYDLDPKIYNNKAMTTIIANMFHHNSRARARILMQNNQSVLQYGHRLVELARRLTSFIAIRTLPADCQYQYKESFLVVDELGIIWRENRTDFTGIANFHAPHEAKEKMQLHHSLWTHSETDPALRRLYL